MTKTALLNELAGNTWLMLKPSPIEGIGVFAIRDISKGCSSMFDKPDDATEWITVSKKEIEALPAHAQFLVNNYCLYDEVDYFLPAQGFKKMDLALFINHSDNPNIISLNDGDYFEAVRDIKAGEELVINYGEIVDGE
jgi:SET domain-containing protein